MTLLHSLSRPNRPNLVRFAGAGHGDSKNILTHWENVHAFIRSILATDEDPSLSAIPAVSHIPIVSEGIISTPTFESTLSHEAGDRLASLATLQNYVSDAP
jgi:hypothetical protein